MWQQAVDQPVVQTRHWLKWVSQNNKTHDDWFVSWRSEREGDRLTDILRITPINNGINIASNIVATWGCDGNIQLFGCRLKAVMSCSLKEEEDDEED